jgi:hypothetical protein
MREHPRRRRANPRPGGSLIAPAKRARHFGAID